MKAETEARRATDGMSEALVIAQPEWTEYRKKNGLDPLGMQNTSVALYQALLPGISNVTLRVRYYGFYAWLSLEYAKRVGDTNPKTWQRYVRRAEALYALIAQARSDEFNIAGTRWANRKLLAAGNKVIDFGADADPGSETRYLKQAWGAYGAAYASQVFEMGIFSAAREHPIPVPSPKVGETLAESFATELGSQTDRFIKILERGTVKRADLAALASMSPSAIRAGSRERNLYEKLLFAEAGLERKTDLDRRKTLSLILELARQFGERPGIDDIRWAAYAGCRRDGVALTLTPDLDAHRRRWWVYQVNDLSHICFEALLRFVLNTLESHPSGLAPTRLIAETTAEILSAAKARPADWASFLAATPPTANAWSDDLDASEWSLCETVMSAAGETGVCGPEKAWAALRLLATLHNRVRASDKNVGDELGAFNVEAFRSVMTELRFLDDRLQAPFQETVARLIEQRVINRHLSVALRKLRFQGDYTFLMETDEGRLRLRDIDGPVFTNPRLGPALTFLDDIHLLDDNGLTARGAKRLESAA